MLQEKTLEQRVADIEKALLAHTEFSKELTEKGKQVNRGIKDLGISKGEELAIIRKAIKHLIDKHGDENDQELETIIKVLEKSEGFIKKELANMVRMPYMPKLQFVIDKGTMATVRINEILKNLDIPKEDGEDNE